MNAPENDQINAIIVTYLSGKASDGEISQLENWIKLSSQNREYYLQVKNIWESSGNLFKPADISTERALQNVLSQIELPKPGFWYYWHRVAAILVIPLIVGGLLWGRFPGIGSKSNSTVVYNEVTAAYGTRSALKLADGSRVWLNSGSRLTYPDKFVNHKRVVKLVGEAYFEVHSDKTQPFIVEAESVSVTATGTKFNVQAYTKDSKIQVSLVMGKVSVNKWSGESNTSTIAELKPNQHLVYNTISGKKELKNEDVYRYIAWKDGKLIFRGEQLSEIAEKISLLYNVEIELHGKNLQDFKYRATFQDESLEEILKLLKLSSPIDYREVKRNPLPDGSFPKKKIIIFQNNNKNV
jgi:ferric-dicitrate binding protein FerR (iron transport regulator)